MLSANYKTVVAPFFSSSVITAGLLHLKSKRNWHPAQRGTIHFMASLRDINWHSRQDAPGNFRAYETMVLDVCRENVHQAG